MPFDAQTGLHTSPYPDAELPSQPLSIFHFVFGGRDGGFERSSASENPLWLIEANTGRKVTRDDAYHRTLDVARAFQARGVKDGDAVVVFSPNHVDYGPWVWGAFRQGAVVCCANPGYTAEELAHQLRIVNAAHAVKTILVQPGAVYTAVKACKKSGLPSELIVTVGSPKSVEGFTVLDDLVKSTQNHPLPSEVFLKTEEARTKVALLLFSSGTTGLPKAVAIPHSSVVVNVLQIAQHWKCTSFLTPYNQETGEGDVVMACLPFFHAYGLIVILHAVLFAGHPAVVLNRFVFPDFLAAIERYRVSQLYLVPPMLVALVKLDLTKRYDLSSMRIVGAGAAPVTEETFASFQAKFPGVKTGGGFGMTETATLIALMDPSFPGGFPGASAGVLLPIVQAKIVSPDGKALPPGEVGELLIRSPANALGYLNNEAATRETFDLEGFVHSGDACYLDANGLLFVVDRIKELIKVSAYQVAPAELEGHLLTHEDVQDVCVIGIPHERTGEAPKAYIALTPSAASRLANDPSAHSALIASIKQFVLDHKVKYKALAEVEIVDSIPKTPSGKLLRKDLRTLHAKKSKMEKAKM
ncbi:hypothetical protein JCM6882_000294 [Rhodosporidiobolus microsporus]